jgi:hypothetical protein
MPEAPTDGTVYGRRGSTGTWLGALPLTGGTVTGLTSFQRTVAANLGSGMLLQAGDTAAGMNVPILFSYKAGATSGAATSIGFNSYVNAPGAGGQRVNATKNGWAIQHDTRLTNDGALSFGLVSSAGVASTPFTFSPDGSLAIANSQALGAGGLFSTALNVVTNLSGTKTGGNLGWTRLRVASDTMHAGAAGMAELSLEYFGGGTGAVGNRLGLSIDFNFAGGTTNKSLGVGNMYGGLWSYARASGNVGGTVGAGNAWGALWGGISSATLESGATFWDGVIAHEFNMGIRSGASGARIQGVKVVIQNNDQVMAIGSDYMIGLAQARNTNQLAPTGISFGSDDGYWPIRATDGRLISTIASNALLAGPVPYAAAYGIDFSAVTFSTAFLKSNGFQVDGDGRLSPLLTNAATDAAASAAGVPVGALYRNGNAVLVRLV